MWTSYWWEWLSRFSYVEVKMLVALVERYRMSYNVYFCTNYVKGERKPIFLLQDVDQSSRSVDEHVQEVLQ